LVKRQTLLGHSSLFDARESKTLESFLSERGCAVGSEVSVFTTGQAHLKAKAPVAPITNSKAVALDAFVRRLNLVSTKI